MKITTGVVLTIAALIVWIVPARAAAPKPRYTGMASWYGKDREGRKMANGEKFDPRALTAACWYFPLNTSLRVVNLKNGFAVTVTVTDRGPNPGLHRVIDLSEAAAEQLDYVTQGVTRVFIAPVAQVRLEYATFDGQLIGPRP